MKKFLISFFLALSLISPVYAGTTTNYGWNYGIEGQSPWWSVWVNMFQSIDAELFRIESITGAYVLGTEFTANSILYATAPSTPLALTVPEQTVVGRATGGAIAALAIERDFSSVSASDNTIPSAKATKAALDNKQTLNSNLTMLGGLSCGAGEIPKIVAGVWTCSADSTGGTPSFDTVATGSNTTATMTVGTGASLNFSGSGTINASSLGGSTWASPTAIGTGTPANGTFAALTATGTTTLATSLTGIAKLTSGVVAAATAGTDYPGLASTNIFTGNNTFGDADTDTLTLRAILAGGNSRAVQITDAFASPTYATTPTSLFVKGPIESLGTIYAAGFESVLTPGNVGFMRMKEDPTNGTNFRAFSVPSALTQDLTFTLPDGNPTANQFFLLGTPSLNISAMSYGTFSTSNFDVTAGTVTIKDQGVTVAKLNGTGTPSSGTYYRGDGSWNTPTASADTTGGAGAIQFNNAGALLSSTGFNWENTNKTLSMTTNGANPTLQIGDGTYLWNRTPAVGIEGTAEFQGASYFGGSANYIDISNAGVMVLHGTASITGRASTTATSGFNLPAGTAPTSPTDGDIWTTVAGFFARINGVSLQMAPVDAPVFTTSVTLPNGASPTTDAAGKIAIRTGSGAASAIQLYGNATPGSVAIPTYHIAGPTTIKDPTQASDYPYLYTPYAITIRAVHYLCIGGTSWTGQIQICDANGGTCGDTQTVDTTAVAGTTTNVTSFSDATVPTSVWMILKTTSVSGSPTSITVQVDYTVD